MVLSSTCFFANCSFLSLLTIATASCFYLTGQRLKSIFFEIRYFLLFLLFVFLMRVITLNDNFIPAINTDQVSAALIFCWKLLLIVLLGVLLMSTTRTTHIRAALVWGMKPLPFINERTTATMVGLVVRLLPLILFQAGEIGDAMRSRCIEGRKNPVIRLTRFTIILFRRAFTRADDLVDALQARCYNEYRTLPELRFSLNDLIAAILAGSIMLTVFLP